MNISLMTYEKTNNNLGDYVQSLAVSKLLNIREPFISREKLSSYSESTTKLILNGWFMKNPDNWPPSEKIYPLIISIHINPTAVNKMLNDKGINFFKKHEPIGCRDYYTLAELKKREIASYFSGCVTLTLKRGQFVKKTAKRSGTLIIGALDRIITEKKNIFPLKKNFEHNAIACTKFPLQFLRFYRAKKSLNTFLEKVPKPIDTLDQVVDIKNLSENERLKKAENFVKQIAKAELVITSRIHTAMPAVAVGTPVIFLEDGLEHINQYSRLIGLNRFFNTFKSEELKYLNVEKLKNPDQHHKFATSIIKKIEEFVQDI